MDEIPYEKGSYYIFDRGYNDFGRLYLIQQLEAYSWFGQKRIYDTSASLGNANYKIMFCLIAQYTSPDFTRRLIILNHCD